MKETLFLSLVIVCTIPITPSFFNNGLKPAHVNTGESRRIDTALLAILAHREERISQ